MHTLFILSLLSYVVIIECNKRCFECTDEPLPSDCRKVIECPDDYECFVSQIVTTSGTILYNSGCHSRQRCQQLTGRRSDLAICEECCAGEFCNNAGCGATVPARATRGPYCFICDHQLNPGSCRDIDMCETDETCFIKYDDHTQHYVTECMPKFQCSALHGTQLIGKRYTPATATCFSCCDNDFCNDNCTQAKPVTTTGSWTQWSTWTACSVSCGHNGQKSRSRQCQGGTGCVGSDLEQNQCYAPVACTHTTVPSVGTWASWGAWTPCSHTCGSGYRHRNRVCLNGHCSGANFERSACNHHSCIQTHYLTAEYCKRKGFDKEVTYAGCIKLLNVNRTWDEAQSLCHKIGGEMFTAETKEKQNILDKYLKSIHIAGVPFVWLGLKNNGQHWFWEGSQQRLTSHMYNNFLHQNEFTAVGRPECTVISKRHGTTYFWFTRTCLRLHHVLCQLE